MPEVYRILLLSMSLSDGQLALCYARRHFHFLRDIIASYMFAPLWSNPKPRPSRSSPAAEVTDQLSVTAWVELSRRADTDA